MAIPNIIDAHYLQQDTTNSQYGKEILKYVFHPDKCNVMSVTRNKNPIKFNCTLYGHPLESLEEDRYVGLTIRQDINWKSHANNVCIETLTPGPPPYRNKSNNQLCLLVLPGTHTIKGCKVRYQHTAMLHVTTLELAQS
jgi:hypothetical protein